MYVGHAALATLAKAARRRVPLAVLVPVAYAPDWVEWLLDTFGITNRELSHSLVAVGIGATAIAALYWLIRRSMTDATVVWLTYASHWPADFITGTKPTWPGGPTVGLNLYGHLGWDALVESVLVVVCWLAYRRSVPPEARRRSVGVLVPVGLIGMQLVFDAIQSSASLRSELAACTIPGVAGAATALSFRSSAWLLQSSSGTPM